MTQRTEHDIWPDGMAYYYHFYYGLFLFHRTDHLDRETKLILYNYDDETSAGLVKTSLSLKLFKRKY